MSRERADFRDCLGRFASGVTVVTVGRGSGVHGATVSSFTSVSLDPPLVLVSLKRGSRLCGRLADEPFGISVLAADQRELALHFAGAKSLAAGSVPWVRQPGVPRLAGTAAFFTCTPWASYDGGDHVLHLGRVTGFEARTAEPLVFHGGAFRALRNDSREIFWDGSLDGPSAFLAPLGN
ncbi:flavin reductase family protein [Streptomyces niger]|uniref:flavin reductase family protein n=1 Tax=Streptomyces niger TaxID=66373 RepID=UPI000AB05534|nr:flavin reductase family protein [Streptomyces niger]